MNSGELKYKSYFEYLGVFIHDTGALKQDVNFPNFCRTYRKARLHVKLDVLEKCVSSALIYACETWDRFLIDLELPYRAGLKLH